MDLSIAFFSSQSREGDAESYSALVDAAVAADRLGLHAVWMPERHFHSFGGLFPNPVVTAAYLAAKTENIRLRAGSVVVPLHHPIRIAEEWSVVDNLSGGRVDLSVATGWHPDDFVLAPESYQDRLDLALSNAEKVQRIWRGEQLTWDNGVGKSITCQVFPRPIQKTLSMWLTCSGNPERFRDAGERGFNVLTGLIFMSAEVLEEHVAIYRDAWRKAGHPGRGIVTCMLHGFVGASDEDTVSQVWEPLSQYMASSIDLWKKSDPQLARLVERKGGMNIATRRYYKGSGLFGDVDTCTARVGQLRGVGIDEIACLVDFGVRPDQVLKGIERLADLQQAVRQG